MKSDLKLHWQPRIVCMSQRHLKRDAEKRLRHAAASACSRRGANAGTVVDVIDTLQEQELLSCSVSVGSLRQANKRARLDWRLQYCNSITLGCDDGSSFTWHTISPHAALQYFIDSVTNFDALFRHHAEGNDLEMLFYHDEIVPGNVLHPDNTRRCVSFYVSFLQWKPLLHSEFAWLPVGVLRTSVLKSITGGLSNCWSQVFLSWQNTFHGRPITLKDSTTILIPIRLVGCIMDESAMHAMWCCKGASGRRPCMKCKNCVAKVAGETLDLQSANYFRDICCASMQEFDMLTDEDAWESVDYLKFQFERLSKTKFWSWNAMSASCTIQTGCCKSKLFVSSFVLLRLHLTYYIAFGMQEALRLSKLVCLWRS